MKKIFIVLTHTGTAFSRLIRRYTGDTYNHISIALKSDLSEMYSFGRLNPYIFFYGGFVVENPRHGTYKRFKQTIAKILEVPVEEAQYEALIEALAEFVMNKKHFHYNFRGLLKARKHINYQKNTHRFYCSQFVKYLLERSGILPQNSLGEVVTPEDFQLIEGATTVYEGLLREYGIHSCIPLSVGE